MRVNESEQDRASLEYEYLTVPEAAARLKVAESTVWRWIANETLPAYRKGRKRTLLRAADVARAAEPVSRPSVHEERISDEVAARRLAAIAATRAEWARWPKRRPGDPSVVDLLHEAREERDRQLMGLE